jgi:hypothetical protein
MSARIDAELNRIAKLGQTPKTIFVGNDLWLELNGEIDQSIAAAIVGDGQAAPVEPPSEVTEYHGIRVVHLESVSSDHLQVQT